MSSAAAAAPQDLQQFAEQVVAVLDHYELLTERLAVLEDQLNEQGWQRLGGNTREFTREGLRAISRMVRIYWLKNPLIQASRGRPEPLCLGAGRHAAGPCTRPSTPPCRRFSRTRRTGPSSAISKPGCGLETGLQLFANLFFVFFINPSTGHVKIRTIPFDEIEAIISNPR